MKIQALKRISSAVKGSYVLLCIAEILICVGYGAFHGTAFGSVCADIAFHLIFVLLIIPCMPLSLFWDIAVLRSLKGDRAWWKKQIVQTVLSPIVYICLWCIACIVFVSATGGI